MDSLSNGEMPWKFPMKVLSLRLLVIFLERLKLLGEVKSRLLEIGIVLKNPIRVKMRIRLSSVNLFSIFIYIKTMAIIIHRMRFLFIIKLTDLKSI